MASHSVIRACIERFRTQEPLPPYLRDNSINPNDFWWKNEENTNIETSVDPVDFSNNTISSHDDSNFEQNITINEEDLLNLKEIQEINDISRLKIETVDTENISKDMYIEDEDDALSPMPKLKSPVSPLNNNLRVSQEFIPVNNSNSSSYVEDYSRLCVDDLLRQSHISDLSLSVKDINSPTNILKQQQQEQHMEQVKEPSPMKSSHIEDLDEYADELLLKCDQLLQSYNQDNINILKLPKQQPVQEHHQQEQRERFQPALYVSSSLDDNIPRTRETKEPEMLQNHHENESPPVVSKSTQVDTILPRELANITIEIDEPAAGVDCAINFDMNAHLARNHNNKNTEETIVELSTDSANIFMYLSPASSTATSVEILPTNNNKNNTKLILKDITADDVQDYLQDTIVHMLWTRLQDINRKIKK